MFNYAFAAGKARTAWVPVLCLALLSMLSAQALANVYATRLEMSAPAFAPGGGGTVTLSFILNESADTGVTLKIYRAAGDQLVRTVNLGPLGRGTHTWVWDGKNDGGSTVPLGEPYYFTVTASDDGHSEWTPIIDETVTDRCKYYVPRGIDVNKDPASKYYGRIYVSEATGSGTNTWSGSPKVTQDGIYILNADCTDAVGQGDNSRTGGVAWAPANSYSPWRCHVGPDDYLYVCDDADSHSGIWFGDPDFLAASSLLDPAGSNSAGLTVNHGSILGCKVYGIGPDRVLYTVDEDYPGAVAQRGSVWQYNIGNSTLPWWGKPDRRAYDDEYPVNRMQNTYQDFDIDAAGDIYVTQNRSDGTDIESVLKVTPDQQLVFQSLQAWGGRDLLRNTYGIAVDSDRGRAAIATYNGGRIIIVDNNFNDPEKMAALCAVGTWAVGAGGTILRSTDRGTSWISVTSPTTNNLNDVFFHAYYISPAWNFLGVAGGAQGTVIKSTDKGATWSLVTSPGTADIRGIEAYVTGTSQYIFAVGSGGAIYRSSDGGATWSTLSSGTTQDLNSVEILYAFSASNQVVYACGNGGVILRTSGDGNTWSLLNSGTTENLYSIAMARHRHTPSVMEYGWAVGDNGTILRTTDNGATWTPQTAPGAAGKKLKCVSAATSLIAKIVAEDGTVWRTKDGGQTWVQSGVGAPANGVRFLDAGLGWAVGPNGAAYVSKDGGASWTAQATGTSAALNAVYATEITEPGAGLFSSWRDVAFDAVGNLYGIDPNLENLRVFSPPDGPNSSTTKSYGVVVPTTGDVTPPSVPVVTDDGEEQNSTSTLHVTWTPSSDPESGVVEYACAISGVPTDIGRGYVANWRSVGTATEYTFTGLDLKIGTYYVLVKAKNGAGIWSDAGVSDGIKILLKYSTLGEIKAAKDTSVIFENYQNPCVVTYVDPGDIYGANAEKWFWVEQLTPDGGLGAAGLKVNAVALGAYFPAGMTAGATITKMSGSLVLPTSQTDTILDMTRELRLDSTPTVGGYVDLPPFLSMPIKSYGGGWRTNVANPGPGDGTPPVIGAWLDESHSTSAVGLNTEGLLVRVSGKVLGYGEDATKGWMWCYIDDGSGVPCEGGINGYKGIKVIKAWSAVSTFPRYPEDIGKQVIVEGICCNRYIAGSGRIRMLLMRSLPFGGDIDVLQFVNP